MYVRGGNGRWVRITSGGIPHTVPYFAADAAVDGSTPTSHYNDVSGWGAIQERNLQYMRVGDVDVSGSFPGDVDFAGPNTSVGPLAISSMGWLGDSSHTIRRYTDNIVYWYSLPLGMFKKAAEAVRVAALGTWAASATLLRIDVVIRLRGYSVRKNAAPWMSNYFKGSTTAGSSTGTGALVYQGRTAHTDMETVNWDGTNYTIPMIRDKAFARETGSPLWTGSLTDLGMTDGEHGLPVKKTQTIRQRFDPATVNDDDGALYHAYVSAAPTPPTIDYNIKNAKTTHSQFIVEFTVEVQYAV